MWLYVSVSAWPQFFHVWCIMLYLDYLGYIFPIQGFPSLLYGTHSEIQRKTITNKHELCIWHERKLKTELKVLFATMHVNQPSSYSRNSKINSFPFFFLTIFQIFHKIPLTSSDHQETAPNVQKKWAKGSKNLRDENHNFHFPSLVPRPLPDFISQPWRNFSTAAR